MPAAPDPSIVRLAEAVLSHADALAAAMTDVIRRDVAFYASNPGLVDDDELHRSCLAQMVYVFEALTGASGPELTDVSVAEETGVRRARAGVPLAMISP